MLQPLRRTLAALVLVVFLPGTALAERVRIPGTDLSIDAPAGFALSTRFPGVEHEPTRSSILVNEIAAPLAEMTAGFTPDNLASRGMTLEAREEVSIDGRPALLWRLTQTAGDTLFEKWIAACGDAQTTVLIVATFPQEVAATLRATLRTAVLSTRLAPREDAGPFDGLRYRIAAPDGLPIQHRVQNMLLLAPPDGEGESGPTRPIAVVGSSHQAVAIDDVAAFARQRITRTAQVTGITGLEGAATQVDGRAAYEITARARDKDSGAPMRVYQMVVVDGVDYFITQGLVGESAAAVYLPKFRAIAESMTIR